MYVAYIVDPETEQVCRFYWVSTYRRALRLAARYAALTGRETFIEGECASYNLANAHS